MLDGPRKSCFSGRRVHGSDALSDTRLQTACHIHGGLSMYFGSYSLGEPMRVAALSAGSSNGTSILYRNVLAAVQQKQRVGASYCRRPYYLVSPHSPKGPVKVKGGGRIALAGRVASRSVVLLPRVCLMPDISTYHATENVNQSTR